MILTDELRKKLIDKLDELIKLPAYLEPFDSIVLNQGLKYLEKNYGDKVPEQFKADIHKLAECFINENWEGLLEVVANVINKIVDIPGLSEDTEGMFFAINIKALFEFAKYYAEKRKGE